MKLKQILNSENFYREKLHELVHESLKEEELISQKLMEIESDRNITFGQKVADLVAQFGGSWSFIISFAVLILLWIFANIYFLSDQPIDPYPFILLNLILSCLAALQAPIIMMSQNRQEMKDRQRERSDFIINTKAEIEIRNLHEKMDLLLAEQMQTLFEIQKEQLSLLKRLNERSRPYSRRYPEF